MKSNKQQNAKCKMQKVLVFLFTFSFLLFTLANSAFAEQPYTLKTGISLDKIPKGFYGTWRVTSKLLTATSDGLFKGSCVDLWNLSRVNNVITLDNPFSGAHSSITVSEVNDKVIKFSKIGDFDGNKLTDTVELILGNETFTGVNYLKLDTVSETDGHVIKSDKATYRLVGEKISGSSITK
jgi:hypothetical protein